MKFAERFLEISETSYRWEKDKGKFLWHCFAMFYDVHPPTMAGDNFIVMYKSDWSKLINNQKLTLGLEEKK